MSGIAGILHLDGTDARRDELEIMADALSHRGPDGVHFYRDGPAGLVSLQMFPDATCLKDYFFSENGVVLDGRLDNASTLAGLLKRKQKTAFHESHAADLIFHSYTDLNDTFPACLLGDFALALWDEKQSKLLLARDAMGLKPLYYFHDRDRILFATEAKAILSLGVPRKPNPKILREIERLRIRSLHETCFDGIFRLPPGAVLEIQKNAKITLKTFWKINPRRQIRMADRAFYLSRFRRLFLEAVRCRLPENGACAFCCSGGLDSSSILGAAKFLKTPLRKIAVSELSKKFPDERAHIEKVVQFTGAESVPVFFEDVHILENIEQTMFYQENPFFEPEDPVIIQMYSAAPQNGARVILGGDWGDQLLTGASYLADLLKSGNFSAFRHEFQNLPKNEGGTPKEILERVLMYLIFNSRLNSWILQRRFGPRFPLCSQRELYEGVFHPVNVLMLECIDRMGAQAGVEVRLPFLDRRLVEFCLAIPPEEKIRDGQAKRLLRDGLKGILLEDIARRRDKGDYTDISIALLEKAGFAHEDRLKTRDLWRMHMLKLWKDIWIHNHTDFMKKMSSSVHDTKRRL